MKVLYVDDGLFLCSTAAYAYVTMNSKFHMLGQDFHTVVHPACMHEGVHMIEVHCSIRCSSEVSKASHPTYNGDDDDDDSVWKLILTSIYTVCHGNLISSYYEVYLPHPHAVA